MSAPSSQAVFQIARISKPTFTVVLWIAISVTLCFLALRAYVRLGVFRRIFFDDALVLLAWLIFLANAILYQVMMSTEYFLLGLSEQEVASDPADIVGKLSTFLRAEIAIQFVFICTLWAVKFSLLAFFQKLGHNVRRQRLIWWCVLVFTSVALVLSLAFWDYACLAGVVSGTKSCGTSLTLVQYEHAFTICTAFDIITDTTILVLPIHLLWRVQVSLRQKLALGAALCLTVVVIGASLTRQLMQLTANGAQQMDLTWLYTCSVLEQAVAIVIACLPSYRALFTMKSRSQDVTMYRNDQDTRPVQYNKYGEAIMMEQQSRSTSHVHVDEIGDPAFSSKVACGPLGT
ncbi:hypothetical protein MMC18_005680 [Xylographa bjoerkii]|nr:hypothetical protein [Xylographa bjoerkii]